MLPVGKGTDYRRSYGFRQIICPLNKHIQNKQTFDKIFKIQAFEVDTCIKYNTISCIFYVKINKIPWNKGG